MFAIYNNGTVGFRSTSDNLYALKNVEELESARFEPKEGLIQNFSNELNKEKKDQFLNSYKKVATLDTLEPVYKARDIMTHDVIYARNDLTIEDIYYLIKEKKVSQIPITGFGKKINDVYLPEVLTADPDSDVRDVVKVMLDLKLDAIPIVDDSDVLMGIISKTDILKAVANLPKHQLWS